VVADAVEATSAVNHLQIVGSERTVLPCGTTMYHDQVYRSHSDGSGIPPPSLPPPPLGLSGFGFGSLSETDFFLGSSRMHCAPVSKERLVIW
jgi:hypothetical protein